MTNKITDLIIHTLNRQPVEFTSTFDTLIKDRLEDAIQNKKIEIAKNLFNTPSEEDTEIESENDGVDLEDNTNG